MESYVFSEAVCNKLQIKIVLINILLNKTKQKYSNSPLKYNFPIQIFK